MSPVEFVRETRRIGFRKAFDHFYHRRHLPLAGYLILASAVGWSLHSQSVNDKSARADLRAAAVEVVIDGCERDNDTRDALVLILRQGERAAEAEARESGSQVRLERAREFYKTAYAELSETDCSKVGERFRENSLDGKPNSE